MNEGLRPIWFDSTVFGTRYRMIFYYGADIDSITILDRVHNKSEVTTVKKIAPNIYTRPQGWLIGGLYNKGNIVIYDHRQEHPIYSNRISKR